MNETRRQRGLPDVQHTPPCPPCKTPMTSERSMNAIILAEKYGLEFDQNSNIYARHEGTITLIAEAGTVKAVAIRAALRKAAERMRERAAETCEQKVRRPAGYHGRWEGHGAYDGWMTGLECAAKIRALSGE